MQVFRWFKHAMTTPGAVNRAFGPAALARIEQAIADSEALHGGEIRFAVEASLPWSYLQRDATARERAEMLFAKLRVWDTELNNGVLIYVELADHRIEIVVDRAVAAQVDAMQWQAIAEAMRERFARREFEAGAVAGIEAVGRLLAERFPAHPDAGRNELPDVPIVL